MFKLEEKQYFREMVLDEKEEVKSRTFKVIKSCQDRFVLYIKTKVRFRKVISGMRMMCMEGYWNHPLRNL